MTPTEEAVLNAIDLDGLLAALGDLVALPSVTGSEAESEAQLHVARLMTDLRLDVDAWELDFDTLRRHPAYSAEYDRQHGLGVVGSLGDEKGGRSLILNGHVDVVPPGDLARWTASPWLGTVRNGRFYGRGALDMKGGLCCALFAAQAIEQAGARLNGRLHIMSVIGEEDGGCGTLAAIERGYRADGAIVVEPTELQIAPAQAGALNFRITVPGRAAHGAMRTEGIDPIEKFILLFQALRELETSRNQAIADPLFAAYDLPYPICIGTVRAGVWASTVAESLTCEGRFGVAVGEDLAAARAALEMTIATAAGEDGWLCENPPVVEWWGGQFAPAAIPAEHPLVSTLAGALGVVDGRSPTIQGMPYGADMRLLVNQAATPTVMFGPGDVRLAHRPDESVPIADLLACTRALALTILRFCSQ